jgi:uncharacterized protein (TIGR01777 family)
MAAILITGGTGLIGKRLTTLLTEKGHDVIILSRSTKNSEHPHVSYASWNIKDQTIDSTAVSKADYIIHLAGAGVADKRWTASRKKEIVESRTESSKLIVKALSETTNKVKAVISASAIGWYGSDDKLPASARSFTENAPADTEFLGHTCSLWEESISPVEALGKRLAKIRIGIVLSNDGGALPEFIKPIKFGFASILGNGKQVISWIHIEDLCRVFIYALENDHVNGIYNAVAPSPVTNKELTLALAKKIKGKFYMPVQAPSFMLKLILGEMSVEVLKSTTVSSDKIRSAGFTFLYPSIQAALTDLVK